MFSQYSTLQDGEGAGNAVQSSARETSVNGGSTLKGSGRETSGGNTNQSETASGVRKKTSSSKRGKGHMERLTFEECVREVRHFHWNLYSGTYNIKRTTSNQQCLSSS